MKAIKYFTPLLSLCLVACQTTNRPQPEASKAELAASMATATASTTPPPATMPDAVQRELNSGALLSGLTPTLETERRFDVSAHDVDAKVFFPSLVQGTDRKSVV